MKKMLIFTFLLLLIFPIKSQAQQRAIIGIAPDAYGSLRSICEFRDGYIAKSEIYVWIHSPTIGLRVAQFAIDYPGIVQPEDTFIVNDNIVWAFMGDLITGIDVATECVTDWNWLIRQTIWITSSEDAIINVVPHSNPIIHNKVVYRSCSGVDHQFEDEDIYYLRLNANPDIEPCLDPLDLVVGVEGTSWGAIKNLYILK